MEAQQPTTTTISVSDLKKIYDIACGPWKFKIERMVKPFENTVTLTEEQIEEMFSASSQSQKKVLEQVFGKRNGKLFHFSDRYTFGQGVYDSPIHIRYGYATEGNENKEIGFCHEFTPIIVIDGKEIELKTGEHGAYLKFKIK